MPRFIEEDEEAEQEAPPPKWQVTHQAYCGMSIPLGTFDDLADAKAKFEARIRWFENRIGGDVDRADDGLSAELNEPEDCCMVPDACGTLTIYQSNKQHIQ